MGTLGHRGRGGLIQTLSVVHSCSFYFGVCLSKPNSREMGLLPYIIKGPLGIVAIERCKFNEGSFDTKFCISKSLQARFLQESPNQGTSSIVLRSTFGWGRKLNPKPQTPRSQAAEPLSLPGTWRFMGSYKWGYKSPNIGFNHSCPFYKPT